MTTVLPNGSASIGGNLIDAPGNTKVRSAATLWVGAAAGDGGFFAGFEHLKNFRDEVAVDEILERRRDEVVLKHGDSESGAASRTL